MDWDKISEQLQKPLDPKHVKPPAPGKYGDYVEGYHVITEANRVFGHGGWSYVITAMDQVSRVEAQDRNGNPQIRVAWKCTVRLTVDGGTCVREGAAVGTGMAKPENEGDAHESAIKEAETDALKRALRTFGNCFGLALYDKTRAHVGVEPEPRDPVKIANSLIDIIHKCATPQKLNEAIGGQKFDAAWQWLAEEHEAESQRVRASLDEHRANLDAEQAAA